MEYKNTNTYLVKIYYKPECIYCTMAENLCKSKDIKYKKIHYSKLSLVEDMPSTIVTYPQIYINYTASCSETYIGGFEDFEKYLAPEFNYNTLKKISKIITKNLNNIIDYNFFPTEKTERSNLLHRPIGIGVQGLANVFYEMKLLFDGPEAKDINKKIFETIYYGSLEASMELSKEREDNYHLLIDNTEISKEDIKKELNMIDEELDRTEYIGSYSSFIGSPIYNGILQFDMWGHSVDNSLWDWDILRENISKYGIRNSLLVAPMPTASTSQILGNYECFEPVISNIYSRRVLAGEYTVLNDYMVNDIKLLGKWDNEMKEKIIVNDGSILYIEEIPQFIRDRYKTAWELIQKVIIDMAIDRGKFICQSQSLNLFMESPSFKKLTSMHFYAWENGLKTGIYYLRSRPSSKAIQFTVAPEICENCSA